MPEVPLVNEILHSGQLAYGKYGRAFEAELGKYLNNTNVIVTNTFNMAILVALSTLGLQQGDVVIASPMACLASTQPLISYGLKVIWADVNPTTGTLCPESVIKKIKYKPKAIFHNHFCGHPGFIDEINLIGQKYEIPIVDDGIEAFGSNYKNNLIGTTGADITLFSFNPVRLPNTIDGGAIIFKNKDDYNKARLIRDAGIDRSKFRDEYGEINPSCDITIVGYSAGINEVSSYIGIQQMKNIDRLLKIQRENASSWDTILKNNVSIKPIKSDISYPNYWVYGTLVDDKIKALKYFRKLGFYASGVHINNNIYSVFDDHSKLHGVDQFKNQFLALPSGWWVNKDSIDNLSINIE